MCYTCFLFVTWHNTKDTKCCQAIQCFISLRQLNGWLGWQGEQPRNDFRAVKCNKGLAVKRGRTASTKCSTKHKKNCHPARLACVLVTLCTHESWVVDDLWTEWGELSRIIQRRDLGEFSALAGGMLSNVGEKPVQQKGDVLKALISGYSGTSLHPPL